MQVFFSEFPLHRSASCQDVTKVSFDWILGSPHTELTRGQVEELAGNENGTVVSGLEKIEYIKVAPSPEACGVRYTKQDSGCEWITTVVAVRGDANLWVGIRVICDSIGPTAKLPKPRKPLVVKHLLRKIGGGVDGEIPVKDREIKLHNSDIDLAARLIAGKSRNILPVVYVSSNFQDEYSILSSDLAAELSGMAHVILEPNRAFSLRLMQEVSSQNVYGGTIGVYWADGGGRKDFSLGREANSEPELRKLVCEEIRSSLTNRRALVGCTWSNIQEQSSRIKIQQLKDAGSKELGQYVGSFDLEVAALREELKTYDAEINRLKSEIRILESKRRSTSGLILNHSKELDYFPNELQCVVVEALESMAANLPPDFRRRHILDDFVVSNQVEDLRPEFRERLKRLLKDSSVLEAHAQKGLRDLNLTIERESKHVKVVYCRDERYAFTAPKTSSDHRAGLNFAQDVARHIF